MAFLGTRSRSRSVPAMNDSGVVPEQSTSGRTSAQGGRTTQGVPAVDQANLPSALELGGFFRSFPGLVQAMQQQAQNQADLLTLLQEARAAPVSQQRLADPEGQGGVFWLERFRRMGPPVFRGESSPVVAESWIREVEKIFRAIRCPEEDKVALATFTLQDRADVWWSSTLRVVFLGRKDISWEDFLAAFKERFFSELVQDRMEQEFLALTQGAMSVMEYEAKFAELEKFAPHICASERRRTAKFVRGLNGYIRRGVVAQDHQTLAVAVRAACLAEVELVRYREEKRSSLESCLARRKRGQSSATPSPVVREATTAAPSAFRVVKHPACPTCGKRHEGGCLKGRCFYCGGVGHVRRRCPLLRSRVAVVRSSRVV